MARGQPFVLDFTFSLLVVLFILLLFSLTWSNYMQAIQQKEELQSSKDAIGSAADFLVLSSGYPENWQQSATVSNVSTLGLKGAQGIRLEKLFTLMDWTDSNYSEVRDHLGLGGLDFHLWVFENVSQGAMRSGVARSPVAYFASDFRDYFPRLNASNLTWDYYWGQGLQPAPDWGTSRNQYSGNKTVLMNQLLQNQRQYRTWILERPALAQGSINATLWRQFLQEGGTIVYLAGNEENELLIANETVTFIKKPAAPLGTVAAFSSFLKNATAGQPVASSGRWVGFAGSNTTRPLVVASANQSETLVSYWTSGLGRVYFINDFSATIGSTPASELFNIAGFPLDMGKPLPATAENVLVQTRLSFLEQDLKIPVGLTLVVWHA